MFQGTKMTVVTDNTDGYIDANNVQFTITNAGGAEVDVPFTLLLKKIQYDY